MLKTEYWGKKGNIEESVNYSIFFFIVMIYGKANKKKRYNQFILLFFS